MSNRDEILQRLRPFILKTTLHLATRNGLLPLPSLLIPGAGRRRFNLAETKGLLTAPSRPQASIWQKGTAVWRDNYANR